MPAIVKDQIMNQILNACATEVPVKAPYAKPSLIHFGSINELTAGGSGRVRESVGNGDPRKKPN